MIEASAYGIPSIRVEPDGSGLIVFPPEQTARVEDALARDYSGPFATEDADGNMADADGPIPHGTYEHTVAAILSLEGGSIIDEEGDDA